MATKKLDTVSPILTAALTAGADVTISHFRVVSSTGVAKTPWKPLAAARTLSAGGKLSLADEAVSVALTGDLARAVAILDAEFTAGDKLEWSSDGTTVTARLAATAITWAAATA